MFQLNNQAAVDQARAAGFYIATVTVDGQEVQFALTLDEQMLAVGIKAVEAQDTVLAELMAQMTAQTQNLTDINNAMQVINNLVSGAGTEKLTAYATVSADDKQKAADINKKLNEWVDEVNKLNWIDFTKIPLRTPPTEPATKAQWDTYFKQITADYDQVVKEINALPGTKPGGFPVTTTDMANLKTIAENVKDGPSRFIISKDDQATLKALVDKGILNLGGLDLTKPLSQKDFETIQKNLSTAQSSQGALNEDLSLRLNDAASKRSAIFTQLQTLLQTLMQTRAALARW